jgi:hypothetical protein
LKWRAILFGVFVDIIVTAVLSVPLLLAFAGPDFFSENEAISRAAEARAYESDLFNLVFLLFGLVCTLLGAFVGARRAACNFVRHGGWVGAGSLLLGVTLLALLPAGPRQPIWVEVLGLLLIIPAGVLGGQLAETLDRSAT